MKKLWITLPLVLLVSCGNVDNSNSTGVSTRDSTNETPVSVTPVSSSVDSVTSGSEFNDVVNTYSVTGCFMDDKNNPVSNLTVGLYDASKVELYSTTTDENGLFNFSGLVEGKYYFRILTSGSDKYKNLDQEWSFEVSGEYYELKLNTITLETDNTIWSDLM